ncbi:MAG: hypothetical protein ACLFU8_08665 [Anaerolineales bacterium]
MEIVKANSVTFEIGHIMAQRCECGGRYEIESQHLVDVDGTPLDRLHAECTQCAEERDFYFDISSFYGQPERYSRFEKTEELLRAGLEAIQAQRWEEAEVYLRRVLDPEEGEPDLGWAHYHLGMVLLVQGEHREGVAEIRRAIQLVPREGEFYRGLSKGLELQGREEEAERARQRYQALLERNQR